MNILVNIDWKFLFACGVSTGIVIIALRMNDSAVEGLSKHIVDLSRDYLAKRLKSAD